MVDDHCIRLSGRICLYIMWTCVLEVFCFFGFLVFVIIIIRKDIQPVCLLQNTMVQLGCENKYHVSKKYPMLLLTKD